jgi:hypothetical protein
VLGARVLGKLGDDPNRFIKANARRDYAGASPITRASGRYRGIFARPVRSRRLGDAIHRWPLSTLRASPGCRAFYDKQRTAGKGHAQASHALQRELRLV